MRIECGEYSKWIRESRCMQLCEGALGWNFAQVDFHHRLRRETENCLRVARPIRIVSLRI